MAGEPRRERGELEAEIMRILWNNQGELLSARELRTRFTSNAPAYTTLMTSLDRLEKKGQVVRFAESPRKVRFRAAKSGDEHVSSLMITALDGAGNREAALMRFAGNLTSEDAELLQRAIRSPKKPKA